MVGFRWVEELVLWILLGVLRSFGVVVDLFILGF